MKTLLAFAVLLLLALPLRAEEVHFEMDGLERRFQLTIPEKLRGPAPLVLVIHGVTESDTAMIRITRGHFDQLAEKSGFVVAYPKAHERIWDIGAGRAAEFLSPRRDDTAYLKRVIAESATRAEIDRDRIFAAGFSQGGEMSFALACREPGLLRAVAVVAMTLPEIFRAECDAAPVFPLLAIHGDEDWIVPIEGGEVFAGIGDTLTLTSHDDTMDYFTRRAGCTGRREAPIIDAENDGTSVVRVDWTGCRTGPFRSLRILGGGHTWPSGGPDLPFIGRSTREINGAVEAWRFFSEAW